MCSIARSISNSWAQQMAVCLCAGVNSMPASCCGSLFAWKVSLNLVSLLPNPSHAAPVNVHCFFMVGVDKWVDEQVVTKDKRLDHLCLWPWEMGEGLCWAIDCQMGAWQGGVCWKYQAKHRDWLMYIHTLLFFLLFTLLLTYIALTDHVTFVSLVELII